MSDWLGLWWELGLQYAVDCGYECTAIKLHGVGPDQIPKIEVQFQASPKTKNGPAVYR